VKAVSASGRLAAMKSEKYVCLVCGRKFPKGQGIVVERAGITLSFHNKSCLAKFFKLIVERIDEKEYKRVVRQLIEEFNSLLEMRAKAKRI
jgi:ribosomal protein L24E